MHDRPTLPLPGARRGARGVAALAAALLAALLTAPAAGAAAEDTAAPRTRHIIDPAAPVGADGWYTGPVDVRLQAEDEGGSGILRTEYRVDGGRWETIGAGSEQVLFDGTQASLDRWRMSGPGQWALLPDGSMHTVHGMGLLWYPREYGDMVIKLQWRDVRPDVTGGSNSGVFVRFPEPDEAVARAAEDRHACQRGSSLTQPTWVAVHCGQEIQIHDGTGGDAHKTGSIYTFSLVGLDKARATPRGQWNDYEVHLTGGGDYAITVVRNGEVINTWANTPGQASSRSGDPATDLRQFATGYFGLQNHSLADHVQFRDVRVVDLADARPIQLTEPGLHTVEYRSVDEAGNVEPTRELHVRIDGDAPAVTAAVRAGPEQAIDVQVDDTRTGAGATALEYRVDGGEWQRQALTDVLFDGTKESFDRWRMVGAGRFVLTEEGAMRTVGGMGMLWYPQRQLGDVAIQMQWRDARPDEVKSNGGVFIRFPDPEKAVAMPPQERHACQVGLGLYAAEWSAVGCGHEIQINDANADPQKTGSVYNFRSLDPERSRPTPFGVWNDYEVRTVGGGDYEVSVIRNGEVINRWRNSPGQRPARFYDPPTDLRQFSSGYVGLQNHGSADTIEYRDVKVIDLAPRSTSIALDGSGARTIEVRAVDAAGNTSAPTVVSVP